MRLQHRSWLRTPLVMWLGLAISLTLLCVSNTVLAHDIYSDLRDRDGRLCCNGQFRQLLRLRLHHQGIAESQCRLQRCQMVVTIYHQLVRLFPPTWQHHRLMNSSTIASIIQWQLSLTARDQYGKANLRLDASLLQ